MIDSRFFVLHLLPARRYYTRAIDLDKQNHILYRLPQQTLSHFVYFDIAFSNRSAAFASVSQWKQVQPQKGSCMNLNPFSRHLTMVASVLIWSQIGEKDTLGRFWSIVCIVQSISCSFKLSDVLSGCCSCCSWSSFCCCSHLSGWSACGARLLEFQTAEALHELTSRSGNTMLAQTLAQAQVTSFEPVLCCLLAPIELLIHTVAGCGRNCSRQSSWRCSLSVYFKARLSSYSF